MKPEDLYKESRTEVNELLKTVFEKLLLHEKKFEKQKNDFIKFRFYRDLKKTEEELKNIIKLLS
jgi:ElaB/YqjD/DUF883 family membrane-anchored ribosome-binding protein